jgi:hypothetical protein
MFLNKIKFRVAKFLLNTSYNQEKFSIDLNEINSLLERLIAKIKDDCDFPIKAKSNHEFILRLKSCNSHYTLELSKHQKIISNIRIETKNLSNYLIANKQSIKEDILKDFLANLKN